MNALTPSINQQLCCIRKQLLELSQTVIGGSSRNLIEWTTAESFRMPEPVRDSNGLVISGDVIWPDGRTGVYTATNVNGLTGTVDAFTITYSGPPLETVTQPLITRDGDGNATEIPNLIIS